MTSPVEAHIDLTALQYNLRRVRQAAPDAKVMAVIKANGYGHGMVQVARALAEAEAFAVARLHEAVELRRAGVQNIIAVLEGFQTAEELEQCAEHNLQPVIHQRFQIELLRQTALKQSLAVWLKIDSGMHRMGVAPETAKECWQQLNSLETISTVRLMTHLASADDRRSEQTEQQLETFKQAIDGIAAETSIANSAGVLGWPRSHSDWVRPGIMLYGVSPFLGGWGEDEQLKPVMTLTSRLIAINHFRKGDAIGYGASWSCPEDMPIGVVGCGYGDGYPRHVVPGSMVLVNGRRVPLVARVSMDSICVDLRQQPDAEVGDPVILWGEGLPVEEVAEAAGTIPYELLCSVTSRVEFHYIT
jgi:alanine racemase